ncbi:MAG TPA: hypothetical protein VGN26_18960 [Armatimonadota bacterium]
MGILWRAYAALGMLFAGLGLPMVQAGGRTTQDLPLHAVGVVGGAGPWRLPEGHLGQHLLWTGGFLVLLTLVLHSKGARPSTYHTFCLSWLVVALAMCLWLLPGK